MRDTLKNIIYIARHFKLATLLNVAGLVVAFATFYLLMTQVIYQATFNHGVNDYERIYRMETDFLYEDWNFSDLVCRPFVESLKHRTQEVESFSLIADIMDGYTIPFQKGDSTVWLEYTQGNNKALSTLTAQVLDGNIEWNDSSQDGLVIPRKIAMDYFGKTQVAGDSMLYMLDDTTTAPLIVRGVFEDFPKNSELLNCIYGHLPDDGDIYSLNGIYRCFIKFREVPEDLDAFCLSLKQDIIHDIDSAGWEQFCAEHDVPFTKQVIKKLTIHLSPLKSSYFEHTSYTSSESGFRSMFLILLIACMMVIILANINFWNFTLAESPLRTHGINTRRVMGASRNSLRLGIIGECVITAVVSCLVALAICQLLAQLPVTSNWTDGTLTLSDHWGLVGSMIAIAVVVGIVAGYYPAACATAMPPGMALNGRVGLTPEGKTLRTILVFLQLVIAMVVVIYNGMLAMQARYIYNSSYGYDKSRILTTTLPRVDDSIQQQFDESLKRLPGIKNIAYSNATLGSTDQNDYIKTPINGNMVNYRYMQVSQDYLRTMGIKITEGRDFNEDDSAAIIVNASARKQWDCLKPGTTVSTGIGNDEDSAVVVGVCSDIRYATMRIDNDKTFFFILDKYEPCRVLNVRIDDNTDIKKAKASIDELLKKSFDEDAEPVSFYNKTLRKSYEKEFRYFFLLFIILLVCMLVTLAGVFCLAIFEREYRRKEIGIRKVLGASTDEIIKMLCRRYIWLILGSFVVAVPIAYYCGKITLDYFKDHTIIHWWLFPSGLLFVGGVILTTVVIQNWRTAHKNPTESIRNE